MSTTSASRFLRGRAAAALRFGDPNRRDDAPIAAGALLAGLAATAVLAAAGAVIALLRPPAVLPDAAILMAADTGALYVRIEDRLHPVDNLTSARLITGSTDLPRPVPAAALLAAPRGPRVGSPGVPDDPGIRLPAEELAWTLCQDDDASTTVLVGTPLPAPGAAAILVAGPSGTRQLLVDGHRHLLDGADPGLNRALGIEGLEPRPVPAALLALIPEGPALAAPVIPGRGDPGPAALGDLRVGDVLRTDDAAGVRHYLVTAAGLARIGAVAADLVRYTGGRAGAAIAALDPALIATVPTVAAPELAGLPAQLGPVRGAEAGVLCADWTPQRVRLWTGPAIPVPDGLRPVSLAGADGPGPGLDAVLVPPGRSVYARDRAGAWLLTDTGVRFGLDDDAIAVLGLGDHPAPAPPGLSTVLPAGPRLSRSAAALARDG